MRELSLMRISRSSVLKIGAAIIGALLEGLYFLFPNAMVSTIKTWLGVTDTTIVAWMMEGILLTGAATIVLVIAITVWQHYGFQITRKKKSVGHQQPMSQDAQIPPQFEIAKCLNCGSKWPVPPLSPLAENILRIGTLYHEKDLPRTVTCPKCGMPAPVTAQPKTERRNRPVQIPTVSQVLPKRETLQRGLNELSILSEAQGYYPSTISTIAISNLIKLDHQKALEICRDLGARELLEVKEMNGHALVRITSRGQKALREAG
jgi:predicted transcriptional regulator